MTKYPDNKLDLNVTTPWEVADVLRAAAEAYHCSAAELEGAWQDRSAGAPWAKVARILESAADRIDKAIQ
jgi:hypothetical protein